MHSTNTNELPLIRLLVKLPQASLIAFLAHFWKGDSLEEDE